MATAIRQDTGHTEIYSDQFTKELRKSRTLRIALKDCMRSASSTSVFLFSVIETLFNDSENALFRNVNWSQVSKTDRFQGFVQEFVKDTEEYRNKQLERLAGLSEVIKTHLKGATKGKRNVDEIAEKIVEKASQPLEVIRSLRTLADYISYVEKVSTEDQFNQKKIKRQLTNLQSRISDLQSKSKLEELPYIIENKFTIFFLVRRL